MTPYSEIGEKISIQILYLPHHRNLMSTTPTYGGLGVRCVTFRAKVMGLSLISCISFNFSNFYILIFRFITI